jgi:murein DD-endopeptidase MepM/ murein hydrolase activator NlpD
LSIFSRKQLKKLAPRRVFKNPFFHFGFLSFVLLAFLFFGSSSLAQLSTLEGSSTVFLNAQNNAGATDNGDLFLSQTNLVGREAPDLKLSQDSFLYGVSTPNVTTTQTLGALLGDDSSQNRKDVVDYIVQVGDTVKSVADQFGITPETVAAANSISKNAALQTGKDLVILPVSGVIHVVKAGDTLGVIAKTYKANTDDIIAFNNLAGEADIYIGDILIIPGGVMPAVPVNNGKAPLPDSFFIFPAEGVITQGLHYFNAVDDANKCGTPIYAAAAGIVQRAVGNNQWNFGMGNYITILHVNGVTTYYGHLQTLFVKPGDKVNVGDRIGLMGRTGEATGCHVHFQVMGAANPLAKYSVGTHLNYK